MKLLISLKTETLTPASFKIFTTPLAIAVDVTALGGGLKHPVEVKKPPLLCLSPFVSSRYRLINAITHKGLVCVSP